MLARKQRPGLREGLLRYRVREAGRTARAGAVPGVLARRGHAGGVAAGPPGPVAEASGGDCQRPGRARRGVRVAARGIDTTTSTGRLIFHMASPVIFGRGFLAGWEEFG